MGTKTIDRRGGVLGMLLVMLAMASPLLAQTGEQKKGSIIGSVRDENGKGLPGVTIRVEESTLGAISKSDGSFRIDNVPAGEYWVQAQLIGYALWRERLTVYADQKAQLSVSLKQSSVQMKELEVRAAGKRQQQSDPLTSVTKIEPREAKYLPGAGEDVMRSLRSLPGVLSPNDFSAQLVVRGSGPDQNLILLDDIEVFNPYRLYGFISMFNPETISDITLLSGGFPARYGDRLSAVLDVTNREGEATRAIEGKLNLSLTNANLVLEGKLPDSLHGGWLISGRRTYYDLILGPIARSAKLVDGDVAFPNFRDLQFKAIVRPWSEHSFVVNALTSRDGTDIISAAQRDRIDSISISDRSYNSLVGFSWRYTPSANILSKTILSWYENRGETQFGGEGGSQLLYGDLSRDSVIRLLHSLPQQFQDSLRRRGIDPDNPPALGISDGNAGFNFRKYTVRNETTMQFGSHLVEVGAGIDFIHTGLEFASQPDSLLVAVRRSQGQTRLPDSISASSDYYRANGFVQDRIAFNERFYLQLGGRYDYYRIISRGYFSPRINASFAIDPITTLRAAFGVYYQSPGYEKAIDGRSYFDLTSPAIAELQAERATHYVLGFDRMLSDEWQVRVEGYYKRFSDLIIQQQTTGIRYISQPIAGENLRYPNGWTTPAGVVMDSVTAIPVNGATGAAYGFEVLLQKIGSARESRLNGWVSYALAWANRYREGITFPFNFDQRHTLNLVLNYKALSWLELGGNLQLGSGYPYTPALGFSPVVILHTDSAGVAHPAIATNIFGEALFTIDRGALANTNSARLPFYERLDLRATFYPHWWDLDWTLYLDVINVLNHTNVLSRSYSVDRSTIQLQSHDVGMLPILPTIGLSLKF